SQSNDRRLSLVINCIRMTMRRPAPVHEPCRPFRLITTNQLVAGLPAHAVPSAELGQTHLSRQPISNKLHALVHHMGLFPGHRRLLRDGSKCYPCPRIRLSPMSPDHTKLSALPQ